MKVTFIGHSTILLQFKGITILTDPFFADRMSFLKREHPAGIRLSDLPPIDIILLSHAHPDHLDMDAIEQLGDAVIMAPRGTFNKPGVRKIHNMEEWGVIRTFGFRDHCSTGAASGKMPGLYHPR